MWEIYFIIVRRMHRAMPSNRLCLLYDVHNIMISDLPFGNLSKDT